MPKAINTNSPLYKSGYQAGYFAGTDAAKKKYNRRAYWIMRKDGWYCSGCNTKNEQKHENYCCKCGAKMSEEADCEYEDN